MRIPFRFNLDDIQSQTSVVSNLPPSVNYKDEGKSWASLRKYELDSQYEITYSIIASVFSKRGLEASTTQAIPVLPVSQAQPPLCPSDFPCEYFFAASTSQQFKPHFSKASSIRLEVAGQEPHPMLLNAHESFSHGLTEVPFVVKARRQTSGPISQNSLPTQCQLKAQLVTKTLVTPNRIKEKTIPTLEEEKNREDSYLRLQKSSEQEFTIAIPNWDHYSPGKSKDCAEEDVRWLINTRNG